MAHTSCRLLGVKVTCAVTVSTAGIVLGVVGGLAAYDLIATGIRYRDESATTDQYAIAATYTSSAASQAFTLSALPIVNPQGFWYYIHNILPLRT
ncbi:hypothetical protein HMPREF2559_08575 [Corynebacterium sp. HMSC072G08]|uniref:Uncharacterized protein n=1 Tax=Corynebacterium phoceense TaxID=1686286 RepID=A0A540R9I9_9CORY|nr:MULTISPECIES: hypothetical protein [Corynebacterium]OFN44712.1 hypothetical protein HMPREF2559_08575 [Corynebacterium sp. HMSC072G08]TQE44409.1 hypothetical protein EJK80_02180 [Corynebacterium phoceense]